MSARKYIHISQPDLKGRELAYVADCVNSGWVSSIGEYVQRFEVDFATFCGSQYGVSVNSGTAALHLALRSLDIGPGDEVIVPALTFAATANAVLYQRATPVFVDCMESNWNMDTTSISSLITNRTRAMIPVHLYGLPCDMAPLNKICSERGIHIIEDCAEAHGATVHGRHVGSFGTVGCFSFYGNKIITTGEGGLCTISDAQLDATMRLLRDHGMDKTNRYWHEVVGYNYRMTNLQAAVGCAQLERIDFFVERRRQIGKRYLKHIMGSGYSVPPDAPGIRSAFWLFCAMLPKDLGADDRDALMHHMATRGIECRRVFHPVPTMPAYSEHFIPTPNAVNLFSRGILLPIHMGLLDSDVDFICEQMLEWLESKK